MDIGGLHFTYGNVAVFAVAVFLLAGVYSFVKQGLKIAALIVLVLAALVFTGGVMWL
ncbi:hypothetical protein BZB76_2995 [Actinomadura pelletieri DSM 43383]|uniref:Uncharacterized protein n=1 Tax=Actinomadura pelletieri DSM 43383 TaxID=1120940 RepID=A0A495QNG3_9ACTN|nr:hypothetical protein [Actinomadura pelletieri]RKS74481.1 hypothetical protein BZB76_2995 [Actinomadura pelletieri DSM 43383]